MLGVRIFLLLRYQAFWGLRLTLSIKCIVTSESPSSLLDNSEFQLITSLTEPCTSGWSAKTKQKQCVVLFGSLTSCQTERPGQLTTKQACRTEWSWFLRIILTQCAATTAYISAPLPRNYLHHHHISASLPHICTTTTYLHHYYIIICTTTTTL